MERFVVGTGRCGSTLLSRMMGEHPQLCSLFEFFTGLDMSRRFDTRPMDGEALADLLSFEQTMVTELLARGYRVPEITYPFGPGARHRPGDPLPWLLVTLLPRLSDDPDALFDEVLVHARSRPPAPPREHYLDLFAWLCARSGKRLWVERSGSSVEYLESLCRLFPDARFLHLHRDGPETALSMREHHAYRLAVTLLYEGRGGEGDPFERALSGRASPALFGRYWSDQVLRGARAWKRLAPEQYRELRFEELLDRPEESLEEVADFLALPPARGWVGRARAVVKAERSRRREALDGEEARALDEACRPGMQLLGRLP